MRKIPFFHVVCMVGFVTLAGVLSMGSVWTLWSGGRTAGAFLLVATFCLFWYLYGLTFGALIRKGLPLRVGEILPGSMNEFVYHVFYLPLTFFWLNPLSNPKLVPVPLTRLFYRLFGAAIGENSYPAGGQIFDPWLVRLGNNVILGYQSVLVPHVIETGKLAHFPISIGNNVTVGVNAVIFAGVTIGDGAIVAAGAVVPKFSRIGAGEVWGGVPARKLREGAREETPDFKTGGIIPVSAKPGHSFAGSSGR